MKRRLMGLLCGFIACLGWHMAQAGAQELEINLPVEFETLQIILTDERQTWLAGYTGEPMSSKPAVLQVTSEGEMRCFEEDATDSSFFFSASLSPDRWILLRTEDGPTSPTEAVVMENGEVEKRIRGLGKAKGVFPVEDGYLFTTMANAGNGSVEMRDAQGRQLWQMELPHMSWVRDVVQESDGFYLTGNYQPGLEDDPLGVVIKLDKEAVKRSGMMIPDSLHGEIPDYMSISLKGKRMLYKSELMMLEMLANTNWERPLYMAITVGSDNHLNLGNNFMQEGLAYRITPFNTTRLNARIDSEKMYDNLMNKFKFGGINNPDIYIDETVMRMCQTHRRMFIQLATQLIKEGKKDKALKALDYCSEVIPSTTVPHDYIMSSSKEMADDYLALGEKEKGEAILNDLANKSVEYITWYLSLDDQRLQGSYEDCLRNFYILDEINKSLARANAAGGVQGEGEQQKKSDMASHYAKKFEDLYEVFNKRVGGGAGRK